MQRVRLVHWHAEEAKERAAKLKTAGYAVDHRALDAAALRDLKSKPPAAVIIDLSRIPSHGRDLALALREQKSTRHIPLVFVESAPEKVERVRKLLPDAVYASWGRIRGAVKRAIANPPKEPVIPRSRMDGYSGTPLPKKLGIKADAVVVLAGAPAEFELGRLPGGASVRRQSRGKRDLTLWFVTSRRELEPRIERMGAFAKNGGLWIVWPKKASGRQSDLTQAVVRKVGL
ncbi:MAG: PleD family two-component system response regulator, partial [Planctomycetota bacterium]